MISIWKTSAEVVEGRDHREARPCSAVASFKRDTAFAMRARVRLLSACDHGENHIRPLLDAALTRRCRAVACHRTTRSSSRLASLLALFLIFTTRAFAITNGNFEAAPFSTGWTLVGTPAAMPGIAPGSVQGARLSATAQAMTQAVAWGAEWSIENYFAVRSTASRQYSLIIALGGTGSGINMRYEAGAFAVFNSTLSQWITLPTLGTLLASTDANADGDLADVGDTKNVYRIRITGHSFGTAGWNYEIVLSEANSTEFTRGVANLTVWQTASGATNFPTLINYSSQNGSNPGFWFDDVKTHEDIPPPPVIRSFTTTAGNIGGPGLPANAQLSWNVTGADTVSISGIGTVAATGTATVTPTTQTNYLLTATAGGVSSSTASVVIAVNASALPPSITEFHAANGLLTDEDGDRPDWIELHNPNAFTLNLAGYSLTDTFVAGDEWTFPLANITPGGYAFVFASAKNRVVPAAPLHTNFSLAASGEYLALHAPGGALVQRFPADYPATLLFPKQYSNVTYGLAALGATKFFKPSTPGAANGTAYDGVVADTVFSVKRGIYSTPQSVAITTPTPGANIRYTTNGTEPSLANGTTYSTPLTISSTTMLRVAAFLTNFAPTNVDTNTYIFPADVVTQPTMSTTITQHATYGPQMIAALTDLPSVSIVTPLTIINGTNVLCSFEFIPPTGLGEQENAGIELFGGAFTNFAKKSFRVSFKSEFGASNIELPGLFANYARGWKPVEKFDQLELRSGSHDMALRGFYMSNIFTDATMLDAGNLNPHGRFAHMYLNGVYWGMFHLRERWSADLHTAYLGGPTSDHESINGNLNVGGWADPGDSFDGTGASWTRIKSLRTNYTQLKQYMDVRSYVDFQLLYMFGTSENEWRSTGPKDIGSGAKYMMNDADGFLATAAYGALAGQNQNRPSLRSNPSAGRLVGDGPGGVFSQLWQEGHTDYKMLLADRIHALLFNNGPLTTAKTQARLTALCTEIERAFYAEAARWSTVHATQYRTPDTWATERNNMLNNWLPARGAIYIGQLQGAGYYPTTAAPAFASATVANGATVNFPVASATVYFTKDGSDPRLPGGGINPSATVASTTTINGNTLLRARALSGGIWSALNESYFTVTALAPGDVLFSEIHYNAQGDDDSEFIELWNPKTYAINLRGAKFTAGLDYDFPDNRDIAIPPGGRLILCASLYSFQKRYGINVPVSAVYFDRLGNDGDTLTLSSGATTLTSLQYQDLAPWPDSADGSGYSLILTNPAAPTLGSSWRTSTAINGNPGTSDTAFPFTGTALADADKDGIPALLEHFFSTNDASTNASPIVASRTVDGRLQITFPRRLAADDLALNVEVSTDLINWTPATTRTAHINNGNNTATETWTAEIASNSQFIRLRVVK